jgi:hypothetical protein
MVPRDVLQRSNRFFGTAPDWIVNETEGSNAAGFLQKTNLKSRRARRESGLQTGNSQALNLGLAAIRERTQISEKGPVEDKKSGLKVVTLIATLNPVSQVLW